MTVAAAMTLTFSVTALAATFSEYWKQDAAGTWYVADNQGNIVKNAWLCDDAVKENGKDVWYLLDAEGKMISAGLVQDQTGNYYSLETNHNGYYGMLRYVSGNYDGIVLDLEGEHNGAFAAIKNQNGLDALKNKYGVQVINIDNSNCVYTSSFEAKKIEPEAQFETVEDISGTSHVTDGKVSFDANSNNINTTKANESQSKGVGSMTKEDYENDLANGIGSMFTSAGNINMAGRVDLENQGNIKGQ